GQVGLTRSAEGAGDRAERLDRAARGGHARGDVTAPVRLPVLLGEDGPGPGADDRPAGGLALAGGLEQEGAAGAAVRGEPAVERDRVSSSASSRTLTGTTRCVAARARNVSRSGTTAPRASPSRPPTRSG